MSDTTLNTELNNNAGLAVQQTTDACETGQRRNHSLTILYLLICVVGVAVSIAAYFYFKPMVFNHPEFDENAVSGVPDIDAERFGYTKLTVGEGYEVSICGLPANDGQNIEFQLTNHKSNDVWIRAEVQDAEGNVLGSSGVLKEGQYLPAITLEEPLTERETPVTVRVIGYEPREWKSRGNVALNLTVYLDYK